MTATLTITCLHPTTSMISKHTMYLALDQTMIEDHVHAGLDPVGGFRGFKPVLVMSFYITITSTSLGANLDTVQ